MALSSAVTAALGLASALLAPDATPPRICTKRALGKIVLDAHRLSQLVTGIPTDTGADPRALLRALLLPGASSSPVSFYVLETLAFADVSWDFEGAVAQTLAMELEELQERAVAAGHSVCVLVMLSPEPSEPPGERGSDANKESGAKHDVAVVWFHVDASDGSKGERQAVPSSRVLLYVVPGRVKVVQTASELVRKMKDEMPAMRSSDAEYRVWTLMRKQIAGSKQGRIVSAIDNQQAVAIPDKEKKKKKETDEVKTLMEEAGRLTNQAPVAQEDGLRLDGRVVKVQDGMKLYREPSVKYLQREKEEKPVEKTARVTVIAPVAPTRRHRGASIFQFPHLISDEEPEEVSHGEERQTTPTLDSPKRSESQNLEKLNEIPLKQTKEEDQSEEHHVPEEVVLMQTEEEDQSEDPQTREEQDHDEQEKEKEIRPLETLPSPMAIVAESPVPQQRQRTRSRGHVAASSSGCVRYPNDALSLSAQDKGVWQSVDSDLKKTHVVRAPTAEQPENDQESAEMASIRTDDAQNHIQMTLARSQKADFQILANGMASKRAQASMFRFSGGSRLAVDSDDEVEQGEEQLGSAQGLEPNSSELADISVANESVDVSQEEILGQEATEETQTEEEEAQEQPGEEGRDANEAGSNNDAEFKNVEMACTSPRESTRMSKLFAPTNGQEVAQTNDGTTTGGTEVLLPETMNKKKTQKTSARHRYRQKLGARVWWELEYQASKLLLKDARSETRPAQSPPRVPPTKITHARYIVKDETVMAMAAIAAEQSSDLMTAKTDTEPRTERSMDEHLRPDHPACAQGTMTRDQRGPITPNDGAHSWSKQEHDGQAAHTSDQGVSLHHPLSASVQRDSAVAESKSLNNASESIAPRAKSPPTPNVGSTQKKTVVNNTIKTVAMASVVIPPPSPTVSSRVSSSPISSPASPRQQSRHLPRPSPHLTVPVLVVNDPRHSIVRQSLATTQCIEEPVSESDDEERTAVDGDSSDQYIGSRQDNLTSIGGHTQGELSVGHHSAIASSEMCQARSVSSRATQGAMTAVPLSKLSRLPHQSIEPQALRFEREAEKETNNDNENENDDDADCNNEDEVGEDELLPTNAPSVGPAPPADTRKSENDGKAGHRPSDSPFPTIYGNVPIRRVAVSSSTVAAAQMPPAKCAVSRPDDGDPMCSATSTAKIPQRSKPSQRSVTAAAKREPELLSSPKPTPTPTPSSVSAFVSMEPEDASKQARRVKLAELRRKKLQQMQQLQQAREDATRDNKAARQRLPNDNQQQHLVQTQDEKNGGDRRRPLRKPAGTQPFVVQQQPIAASSSIPSPMPTPTPSARATRPSNRKLIQNAIEFTLLAGGSVERARVAALEALAQSPCSNFVVLLKSAQELQFRALYEHHLERGHVAKLFAVTPAAPPVLAASDIVQFFRYNSGKKEFTPIDARSFTARTDACALADRVVFRKKATARPKL